MVSGRTGSCSVCLARSAEYGEETVGMAFAAQPNELVFNQDELLLIGFDVLIGDATTVLNGLYLELRHSRPQDAFGFNANVVHSECEGGVDWFSMDVDEVHAIFAVWRRAQWHEPGISATTTFLLDDCRFSWKVGCQ